MKKSKYIFAIMAVVYLAVAISGSFGWIAITENVLLGLSLSALLSSVSDILYNIRCLCIVTNEFNYIIRTTSMFIEDKLLNNSPIYNPNIIIRNVKLGVESMGKNYEKAVHKNEYYKKKFVKVLYMLSQVCFVISIGAFILAPFIPAVPWKSLSSFLTLVAFAAMSCNLHMSEAVSNVDEARNNFMNNEKNIIQTVYPDFLDVLNTQLYYHEDYIAAISTQESDLNANT